MARNEREEYSEWNVKEYEEYLAQPLNCFGRDRMWDVAKYNPYAAYMFARRMEDGEIERDDSSHYLMRSAEYGCSRAFWRLVTHHPGEIGVRNLCVVFDRCVGFREDSYGREQRLSARGCLLDVHARLPSPGGRGVCRNGEGAGDGR